MRRGTGRKAERGGAEETVRQARYSELPPFFGEWANSLVSPEGSRRTRGRIHDLLDRLEGVRRHPCNGSEAARAFMDASWPDVAAETRCRMAILADHVSAEKEIPIAAAAAIVCEHARVLGDAWEAEMVESGSRSLIRQLFAGELLGLYVERVHPAIVPGETPRAREGRWDLYERTRAVLAGGVCTGSEAARCAIDSVLPMLDDRARCVLSMIADYLAAWTETSIRTAAAFIADQSRVLGKGRAEDLMERGAGVLIRRAEYGLLPGSHMDWVHHPPAPPRPKKRGFFEKLEADIRAWFPLSGP